MFSMPMSKLMFELAIFVFMALYNYINLDMLVAASFKI